MQITPLIPSGAAKAAWTGEPTGGTRQGQSFDKGQESEYEEGTRMEGGRGTNRG